MFYQYCSIKYDYWLKVYFLQDKKYYSQKLKPSIRYKPAKLQYIIHPPNVERTLPIRNGINPRDAVWQKVHSTKYYN